MEYKLDKEIDSLLRQAARSGQIVSSADFNEHLDADEISMFAENALPAKARATALKHLADCNRCRNILSSLIAFNEETESPAVSVAAEEQKTQIAAVPWYKKLFVFPQIAYAMGALALVFSGAVGFLIYQTANQTGSFEMAKSSSPTASANSSLSNSNNNVEFETNLSNMMMTNSATSADSDVAVTANSNSSVTNAPTAKIPSDENQDLSRNKNEKEISPTENRPAPIPQPSPVERKDREEEYSAAGSSADDSTTRDVKPPKSAPPPLTVRSSEPKKKNDQMDENSTKLANKSAARQQIGKKVFNRINGVWIDSEYDQRQLGNLMLPPTVTVRRGSDAYKKLDANIRRIAESLEGAVIVVSGGKAYRIQ